MNVNADTTEKRPGAFMRGVRWFAAVLLTWIAFSMYSFICDRVYGRINASWSGVAIFIESSVGGIIAATVAYLMAATRKSLFAGIMALIYGALQMGAIYGPIRDVATPFFGGCFPSLCIVIALAFQERDELRESKKEKAST